MFNILNIYSNLNIIQHENKMKLLIWAYTNNFCSNIMFQFQCITIKHENYKGVPRFCNRFPASSNPCTGSEPSYISRRTFKS